MYGWRAVLIGALSALVFFTRQNSIGIPLAIGVYLVVARWRARELDKLWGDLVATIGGALLLTVPLVVYFVLNNALADFWDAAFVFNFFYIGERGISNRLMSLCVTVTGPPELI